MRKVFLALLAAALPAISALADAPAEEQMAHRIGVQLKQSGQLHNYEIGVKFHDRIAHMWPMSSFPEMLPRAERFMKKWGVLGIFIGRFSGPLRATVPLVAGVVEMPYWRFQFANFSSAFLWAAALMAPGIFGVKMLM